MTGIVVAIDEASCRVRVEFPDRDDGEGTALVSDWLPVGQRKTLGDLDYWLPDEGTQVACLMDEHCEAGVVLCAIYSDADPPPVSNRDLYYRRFRDGSVIQYDRAGHKLSANIQGEIEVTATGNITSTAQLWTHNGKLLVTEDIESQANIKAANNVADQGGTKTMAGMRTTYDSHTHPDPQGGNTGQPSQEM
jgi:phage baseplate assembly protein V